MTKGPKAIRAKFADATAELAQKTGLDDPSPLFPREGFDAGKWDGAPFDKLPPGCPVVPLGVDGKISFFVDTLGQLLAFDGLKEDGLIKLFRETPNFLYWAWPRWSAPKSEGDEKPKPRINGVEVKKAIACLEKECAKRGLFDPANRVRGRGAWADRAGRLIWHSGDALWTIGADGKLKSAPPGEVDGIFYPRRAKIMPPWQQPVPPEDSPARDILEMLRTWKWERPKLDPIIVLGGIGVMIIGGALRERPHMASMGDFGVGKSALNALIKGIVGSALIDVANATEAGIRQHMGLDALPVAIDEFEATEDNRRVNAILDLARIAYSGARMVRGGQDHKGVEFIARNAFFCSGINLPTMNSANLSRFAVLDLRRLEVTGDTPPPVMQEEWGRMLLRSLMDEWPKFHAIHADWRRILSVAGLSGRHQDTYGTLFAVAQLLLGLDDMEKLGLPISHNPEALGEMIAAATADERASQIDNWRDCLEHLIGSPIDQLKNGKRATLGALTELLDISYGVDGDLDVVREGCAHAGVGLVIEDDASAPIGKYRYLLAVPPKGPLLEKIFAGKKWQSGGWFRALKQAPETIVRRGPQGKVVKINRASERCLLIDLRAYDKHMEG